MNKDKIRGLYFLWILVLFVELIWLFVVSGRVHSAGDLTVAVTVIAVSLTVGAVGLKLFEND